MNKDINDLLTKLNELEQNVQTAITIPVNFVNVGYVQRNDVQIYLKQDVYWQIKKFSNSNTKKELGGVLIGDYTQNMEKYNIIISDYLEAKYTGESSSSLAFTDATWDYIYKEQSRLYPNKKILGLHHTHPNSGIFLLSYDIFIQENFFNRPWQIAYIVDPINKTDSFFQWEEDKVTKVNGFHVYDDIGKTINMKKPIPKQTRNFSIKKLLIRKTSIFIFMAFLLISTLLISTLLKLQASKNQVVTDESQYKISVQNNKFLANKLEKVQKELILLKTIKPVPPAVKIKDNAKYVVYREYVFKKGDTLSKVCNEMGINYYATEAYILRINGITNLNTIHEGTKVILPLSKK